MRLKIKAWLSLLILLATAPIIAFSCYTLYEWAQSRQEIVLVKLKQNAEVSAKALRRRLDTVSVALGVLAQTDAALNRDLRAFYEHALRFKKANPDIQAVILSSTTGEQLFNTYRPFGSPLPKSTPSRLIQQVVETGRPAVSDLFKGAISGEPMVSLAVPVLIDGKVAYVLRAAMTTEAITAVLREQQIPEDWTASVVDSMGTYVARTRLPEQTIGTKAPESLRNAIQREERKAFDAFTHEGVAVKGHIVKVPTWDWTVAVGVPRSVLNAPLYRSLFVLVLGGAALMLVGATLAFCLSRRLAGDMQRVLAASTALSRGEAHPIPPTHINELDQLSDVLHIVGQREREAQLALSDAMAMHQQVSAKLNQARLDHLTGVPSRGLFMELAEQMRDRLSRQQGRALALLFIDLDGFKQVNDRLGHDRGDEVLVRTARILRDSVRETDIVGRLGGDEFVACIVAPVDHIETTAAFIALRIIEGVSRIGDGIGCSIGIAVWPNHCEDVACVLHNADAAMYEAKRRGRNRHVLYSDITSTAPDAEPSKGQGAKAPEGTGISS